jgi:hypothetical protein
MTKRLLPILALLAIAGCVHPDFQVTHLTKIEQGPIVRATASPAR